jgi:hypothetical protein
LRRSSEDISGLERMAANSGYHRRIDYIRLVELTGSIVIITKVYWLPKVITSIKRMGKMLIFMAQFRI